MAGFWIDEMMEDIAGNTKDPPYLAYKALGNGKGNILFQVNCSKNRVQLDVAGSLFYKASLP